MICGCRWTFRLLDAVTEHVWKPAMASEIDLKITPESYQIFLWEAAQKSLW